jgi:2-polyprenyl-3-methyl-5-hydroxy-6-metoxy-1,4-benzoquinol methylase
MKQVRFDPAPAVLLAVPDLEVQRYLQAYPLLNGTSREVNESILASIEKLVTVRRPHEACDVERLAPEEYRLTPDNERRVLALLGEIGYSANAIAEAMDLLAWKFHDLPPDARNILDIGGGGGDEVVFLRAIAPQAKIVAIDWRDAHPKVKKLTGVEFRSGDFRQYLEQTSEQFDIIFSNHVLEHTYDPDAVLTLLRRHLAPGAKMFGALPLDGAIASLWPRLAANHLSVVDLGGIDFGHPWKTTPSDLRETLLGAGFTSVRLVQRQQRVNRTSPGEESELQALENYGRHLDRFTFAPLRWMVRTLFGRLPPHPVVKIMYALESRAWFGPAQLKNSVAPEILAVASAA